MEPTANPTPSKPASAAPTATGANRIPASPAPAAHTAGNGSNGHGPTHAPSAAPPQAAPAVPAQAIAPAPIGNGADLWFVDAPGHVHERALPAHQRAGRN